MSEQENPSDQFERLNAETLADGLKSYQQAILEEFEIAANGTSDEIASKARERLALLLPEAGNQLLGILRKGGKEDAVRLNAIKLIFEYTLGKPAAKNTKEDDVDRLIKSLTEGEKEGTPN